MERKTINAEAVFGPNNNPKKYYVYRLVDPRTFQTFYVGKGCGDRVLQHAQNAMSMQDISDGDLKSKQISEILGMGKEVISIIHRRGLTESQAFEVESALIDVYPGVSLTNKQSGHDCDRGCISLDDLIEQSNAIEYEEPVENYVIIKTSNKWISTSGSLYEATRKSWRGTLKKAQKYEFVLSVINGIVREVYKVSRWYQDTPERIAFEGEPASGSISGCKGKLIPAKYRAKGAANPFMYKK